MKNLQKHYQANYPVRQLIRDNNSLLMVLSRFNIPFGFGDSTVAEVCLANKVDIGTFLAVCNLLSSGVADNNSVHLPSLIEYLKRAHASFLEISLPRIRQHLIEAVNYDDTEQVTYLLMKFFDDYVKEVKRHMEEEEKVVFKYAESLLNGSADTSFSISDFSANHSDMASKLHELKDLFIYHYTRAENMRMSATLFDIITCEKDLLAHFEVENRLFIPAIEKLEREYLRSNPDDNNSHTNISSDCASSPILSEREKDIIGLIAKGKSNKEIADNLCISVHTVTTHRRNISSKLDIHSGAGLAIYAIIHNIVKIEEISPR